MSDLDARSFVDRPWALLARRKRRHWADVWQRDGSDATMAAAWILHEHMKSLHPDWPRPEDRRQDLADHLRLADLLHRADRARADS